MENFKKNPIIILDDDTDDQEFISTAIRELGYDNKIEFYITGEDLIRRLKSDLARPFIIISELNLQVIDGLQIRKMVAKEDSEALNSIPFLFWSSSASPAQVREAYKLWSQGVFIKPSSYNDIKNAASVMLTYWTLSSHPTD